MIHILIKYLSRNTHTCSPILVLQKMLTYILSIEEINPLVLHNGNQEMQLQPYSFVHFVE